MWIVRCGHRLLYVIHGVQLGDYNIFKNLALITVNVGQNPTDIEPFINEDLGDGKYPLVGCNKA